MKSQWIFGRMLFDPTSENSNLSGSDGKAKIGRTPHEAFNRKCTTPTVKHGDDLGLFHPSESWKTVCIMDRFDYRDILEQNLQPSINDFKLNQRCIFMYDNGAKNTLGLIKDCLKRKGLKPSPVHQTLIP